MLCSINVGDILGVQMQSSLIGRKLAFRLANFDPVLTQDTY